RLDQNPAKGQRAILDGELLALDFQSFHLGARRSGAPQQATTNEDEDGLPRRRAHETPRRFLVQASNNVCRSENELNIRPSGPECTTLERIFQVTALTSSAL